MNNQANRKGRPNNDPSHNPRNDHETKHKPVKHAFMMQTFGIIGLVLFITGTLTCFGAGTLFRDWLIIGFGIRTQRAVLAGGVALLSCGVPLLIAFGCFWLHQTIMNYDARREQQASDDRAAQILQDHMEGRVDPTILRHQFMTLAKSGPAYIKIADRAIDQMDRIDSIQSRQQLLIQSNDAKYLADTESALIEVEQRIWRNLRHIYNLYIAVDDIKSLDTAKVERYISDNEAKLSSAQELVVASADWINQYESDKTSDRSKVESWLATIRESLQEED